MTFVMSQEEITQLRAGLQAELDADPAFPDPRYRARVIEIVVKRLQQQHRRWAKRTEEEISARADAILKQRRDALGGSEPADQYGDWSRQHFAKG